MAYTMARDGIEPPTRGFSVRLGGSSGTVRAFATPSPWLAPPLPHSSAGSSAAATQSRRWTVSRLTSRPTSPRSHRPRIFHVRARPAQETAPVDIPLHNKTAQPFQWIYDDPKRRAVPSQAHSQSTSVGVLRGDCTASNYLRRGHDDVTLAPSARMTRQSSQSERSWYGIGTTANLGRVAAAR